eukprot:2157583-Rhodomonas_salina.1
MVDSREAISCAENRLRPTARSARCISAPSNNALYAFGTRHSRLPGSPVSCWYSVGAHYPVRARYFAQ